MSNPTKMALATSPYASVPALLADARLKVTGEAIDALGSAQQVRDADGFAKLTDAVRAGVAPAMQAAVAGAGEVLALAGEITTRLDGLPADTAEDISEQLGGLVYPGFIAATPAGAWRRLPTYLRAIRRRIEGSRTNARQESAGLVVISELEDEYAQLCAGFGSGTLPPAVAEVGWLLEELRVSLFAQTLGTAVPVSAKRVRTAMAAAKAGDSH